MVQGEDGAFENEVLRDREASFEPRLIAKGQTRTCGLDDKIIAMYARGMSVQDIHGHLEELYGLEVSPEPHRVCRRLHLLRWVEPDEQDNEPVFP